MVRRVNLRSRRLREQLVESGVSVVHAGFQSRFRGRRDMVIPFLDRPKDRLSRNRGPTAQVLECNALARCCPRCPVEDQRALYPCQPYELQVFTAKPVLSPIWRTQKVPIVTAYP